MTADFLSPAKIRQTNEQFRFWKRSSEDQKEKYEIHIKTLCRQFAQGYQYRLVNTVQTAPLYMILLMLI